MGSGGCKVSHLQFVDDTLIFCDANVRQLGFLRCLIRCFKAVSGLNRNLPQSELFQIGVFPNIDTLAWILGCKIGSLPSYFGLPLGELVVERNGFRLESWKASLLSKGAILTLLKSTLALASIPNYYLSLFTIPVLMATRIGSKFHNFLWNDSVSYHHYHLLDWNLEDDL